MISIIISTYQPHFLKALKSNIENTIGVPYEIIAIPNRNSERGICEVYNIGAAKSKYPYLLFIHEDINFLTPNWGTIITSFYSNQKDIGVVGFAGSTFKPKIISSWFQPEAKDYEPKRSNIVQHYKFINKQKDHNTFNPENKTASKVATLDGVFLFTSRRIWEEFPFDQSLLKGFHGYDLDFTLTVGKKYNNYVLFNILIEHFSDGNFNDYQWLQENYLVHKKFKRDLPVKKDPPINSEVIAESEKYWLIANLEILAQSKNIVKSLKIFAYLVSSLSTSKYIFFFMKMFVKFFLSWPKSYFSRLNQQQL